MDEEWPALPSAAAAEQHKDERKALPLPGLSSPAETRTIAKDKDIDDVNDLTLRRVQRHDEDDKHATAWMSTDRIADTLPRTPTPVPAALAPAQGYATPKILKRPVSGSFSMNQGQAKTPMYAITEDSTLRTRSTTQSSMDHSVASVSAAGYSLAPVQVPALSGASPTEADEYGPVTPAQGTHDATPRVLTHEQALSDPNELRDGQGSLQ